MNRGPTFRFVNAIEYITVGYYDEIKMQRIKEHSNEVGDLNLLVYLAVTRKLRHVTMTEWGMIDYIEKCHQLTKIPTMRYIYNSCAKVHMCG